MAIQDSFNLSVLNRKLGEQGPLELITGNWLGSHSCKRLAIYEGDLCNLLIYLGRLVAFFHKTFLQELCLFHEINRVCAVSTDAQ